jgi:hypothetical protein
MQMLGDCEANATFDPQSGRVLGVRIDCHILLIRLSISESVIPSTSILDGTHNLSLGLWT